MAANRSLDTAASANWKTNRWDYNAPFVANVHIQRTIDGGVLLRFGLLTNMCSYHQSAATAQK
jgi:hypothetical protein